MWRNETHDSCVTCLKIVGFMEGSRSRDCGRDRGRGVPIETEIPAPNVPEHQPAVDYDTRIIAAYERG
jgi:hypothetical protein